MDLRSYTAVLGNRAKGGGCECQGERERERERERRERERQRGSEGRSGGRECRCRWGGDGL